MRCQVVDHQRARVINVSPGVPVSGNIHRETGGGKNRHACRLPGALIGPPRGGTYRVRVVRAEKAAEERGSAHKSIEMDDMERRRINNVLRFA